MASDTYMKFKIPGGFLVDFPMLQIIWVLAGFKLFPKYSKMQVIKGSAKLIGSMLALSFIGPWFKTRWGSFLGHNFITAI